MMKWLVLALFYPMVVEASLRKTKAKTAVIAQNPFGIAVPPSKQSPHGESVLAIKKWSHSHLIREGNDTGKNETKHNETQRNETKGNETGTNETKGNETGDNKTEDDHKNSSSTPTPTPTPPATPSPPPQYTIKSVETRHSGIAQYLNVGELGSVSTQGNVDGDACKWTLYTGLHGGITIANVKWPDKHLSIIYETEVNQRSWKYVASTCSDDEKCYDEWTFYTLKGAAKGVMMYLDAESLYLEEDCLSGTSPTKDGLWIFDPPLPANMIEGEKEEASNVLEDVFR